MDAITAKLVSALQGRYAIDRELGQGGMATVYLARDLRHDRKVALKVLKPELAAVVGAQRFLSEIRTTANLHHPHILPLHDSGESDGFLWYVMPYVEGESLAERLEREKQLPVGEAVSIASHMAAALQHAHDRGVIHRDIKPGNILLQDGEPVMADFGIAFAVGAASATRLTETGLSLGTPYYMSPEQATGDQQVGPPSDTYALACVLYEMLVGEPPYTGKTAQAVLGKIITGEMEFPRKRRPSTPANVDGAIRRALEKLPADRFASAGDFAKALGDPTFRHGESATGASDVAATRWKRVAVVAGCVAVLATFGSAWFVTQRPLESRPLTRFDVSPAAGQGNLGSLQSGLEIALSADGSRMAYLGRAASGVGLQLWQRPMNTIVPEPIPGTEDARSPVFSPDGQTLAFVSGQSLRTVSLVGGSPITVMSEGLRSFDGIDWGRDGMLYFRSSDGSGIKRIPSIGGELQTVTDQSAHNFPDVLPDGHGLLITIVNGPPDSSRIAVANQSGEVRELFPGTMARYEASGHIVFTAMEGAQGILMAAPFDLERLEVTGPAVALVEGVQVKGGSEAGFDVSSAGDLIYKAGSLAPPLEPVWIDREGRQVEIEPEWIVRGVGTNVSLVLSPDDNRLALSIFGNQTYDVWVKRLDTGTMSRLTTSGLTNRRPFWSNDGNAVMYIQRGSILRAQAEQAGQVDTVLSFAEEILAAGRGASEVVISPNGDRLVYRVGTNSSGGNPDIHALRIGVDSVGTPLLTSEFWEWAPSLSPDGKWLAYVSDETGRQEVYVRPFPNVDSNKWPISTDGGRNPMWAHNGRELFYQSGSAVDSGDMIAVEVETNSTFSAGRQTPLCPLAGFLQAAGYPLYDVTTDDRRFVMFRNALSVEAGPRLILVQNFLEALPPVP